MPRSDYVFVSGDGVFQGSEGQKTVSFISGEPVIDTNSQDSYVFEAGNAVGSGLVPDVRWDASKGDTLLSNGTIAGDNEYIDEWADAQGSNKDATGYSPIRRDNSLNGNPIVEFDGPNGSDFLDVSPNKLTYEQPFTFVCVPVTVEAYNVYTEIIVGKHPDATEGYEIRYRNSPEAWSMTDDVGNRLTDPSQASPPALLTCVFDSNNSRLRVDGTEVDAGTMASYNMKGLRLGNNESRDRSMGELAEVRAYNRDIVASGEVDAIEESVANTWGLTI